MNHKNTLYPPLPLAGEGRVRVVMISSIFPLTSFLSPWGEER
jgi:hypothetical protein